MAVVSGSLSRYAGGAVRTGAMVAAALLLGGCAGLDLPAPALFAGSPEPAADTPAVAQNELQKATEYWGEKFSKDPKDADAALSYAKNLKAMGQKQQALGVLQQASLFHSGDPRVNSEYGRLALELDQISTAAKLLQAADNPAKPDWRVVSARGTVLAKQGKYAEAISYYERAQQLSANQPSVQNNLALAYAMNGEAPRAEEILRRVVASGSSDPKVRQNLALVLGLQGKYDEAKMIGAQGASVVNVAANTDVIKQMVGIPAKPYSPPVQGTWAPSVVAEAVTPAAASASASTQVWQTRTATEPARPAAVKTAAVSTAPVASAGGPSLRPSAN